MTFDGIDFKLQSIPDIARVRDSYSPQVMKDRHLIPGSWMRTNEEESHTNTKRPSSTFRFSMIFQLRSVHELKKI